MPFTQGADARIYWKLEGSEGASTLVLLNSIGTDMDLWDAMLPQLRRSFHILRVDTRGHGASDATPGDYSLSLLAADVAAVLDDTGLSKATVAGVSLGGMIAMRLALDRPDLVSALALICTSPKMDRAAWSDRVDAVREHGVAPIVELAMGRFLSPDFIADNPGIAATIRAGLERMSSEGYAGCAAAIRDMDLRDALRAITQPTLVVTGTRDISTPLDGHGQVLLEALAHASHIVLDSAHLAPIEAPSGLAQSLRAFEASHSPPP
jgi:3-oxoadipate enol-lactonase